MNFGHGFYNDHHFHHGYIIYGAATVAKFDAVWGRNYFDPVLALIRDIANPSHTDKFFPPFRHKDVYLGVSWASGIGLINGGPYPNGRNQESSSESIAAYEAMALYGQTMNLQWGQGTSSATSDNANAATAASLRDMSRFLLSTEIRSAARYYHVRKTHKRIYPKEVRTGKVTASSHTKKHLKINTTLLFRPCPTTSFSTLPRSWECYGL
jgi:endo-1,3(4)-beta-glucanase